MSTKDINVEKCKGCGTNRVSTGAPIWDDYCPNELCTYDKDELLKLVQGHRDRFFKDQAIRDAAPDMLEALEAARKYIKRAPYSVFLQMDAAIAKAKGQ